MITFLPLFDQGPEVFTSPLSIEAIFRNISTYLPGIIFCIVGCLLVIDLRHFYGLVQRITNLQIKPVIDAVGEEVDGHDKEKSRRNKGKTYKSSDQFRPELRPYEAVPPLKDQFDNIPDNQKEEKNN